MANFRLKSLAILLLMSGSALAEDPHQEYRPRDPQQLPWNETLQEPVSCNTGDKYGPLKLLPGNNTAIRPLAKRGSTFMEIRQWPGGKIPYILDNMPHWISEQIRSAMREWEVGTCIRFVPKTDADTSWLTFRKDDSSCTTLWHGAPPEGGSTIVNLDLPNFNDEYLSLGTDEGCGSDGTVAHELGHVIGLVHEHQRRDRDQYVRIEWDHIADGDKHDFEMFPCANIDAPFDYNSIMMYPSKQASDDCGSFSWLAGDAGCKHTITSLTDQEISPDEHPTLGDLLTVNLAYNCPDIYRRQLPWPRRVPEAPAERWEISNYEFIIDSWTEKWMTDNNWTDIAVHQHCDGEGDGHDSNNWNFTTLAGSGEENPYKLQTDRCREGHNRRPRQYEIALCSAPEEEACTEKCGLREIMPVTPEDKDSWPKAVDVVDDVLWVCHKH